MAARGSEWRSTLRIALAAFALAVLFAGPLLALQRRAWTQPAVVALGSGSALSVMVIAGEARILLASGDDPIAFGNALSRVQPLTARRIDAVIAVGSGPNLVVPQSLANDPNVRWLGIMGPGGPTAQGDPLARAVPIVQAQRLQLPSGVEVRLEPWTSLPNPDRSGVWRVSVALGEARVVILSDGTAASAFASAPAEVAVVTGGAPLEAVGATGASGLVAASDAVSGDDLRAAPDPTLRWARRVFPGESATIRLTPNGATAPTEGIVRPDPATPPAGTPAATPVAP